VKQSPIGGSYGQAHGKTRYYEHGRNLPEWEASAANIYFLLTVEHHSQEGARAAGWSAPGHTRRRASIVDNAIAAQEPPDTGAQALSPMSDLTSGTATARFQRTNSRLHTKAGSSLSGKKHRGRRREEP